MAAGPPDGDGGGVHDVPPGDVLPVGVAVPPSAPGHPPPQITKAKDQKQRQGEEQSPGRPAALFRLHHAEEQNHQDTPGFHLHWVLWPQHTHILSGKSEKKELLLLQLAHIYIFHFTSKKTLQRIQICSGIHAPISVHKPNRTLETLPFII